MVAPAIIAAGIGAASSLLGGLLGKSSAEEQAEKDRKLQLAFAQQGIRWKVADAEAAGIHPLYALGANTTSYSPVAFNDPLPQAIANAGQDISWGINNMRTAEERVGAYGKTVQALTVERMGLENTLLASQIAKINQAGGTPAMPGASGATSVNLAPGVDVPLRPGISHQDLETELGEGAELYGFGRMLEATADKNREMWLADLIRLRDWLRAGPGPAADFMRGFSR